MKRGLLKYLLIEDHIHDVIPCFGIQIFIWILNFVYFLNTLKYYYMTCDIASYIMCIALSIYGCNLRKWVVITHKWRGWALAVAQWIRLLPCKLVFMSSSSGKRETASPFTVGKAMYIWPSPDPKVVGALCIEPPFLSCIFNLVTSDLMFFSNGIYVHICMKIFICHMSTETQKVQFSISVREAGGATK